MLLDCIKSCYFPIVVVLLPITVSSQSPSFLAIVSSNVSFSFFYISNFLYQYVIDILLSHSNFVFSICTFNSSSFS